MAEEREPDTTPSSDRALPGAPAPLLGIYLLGMPIVLSFFFYVLWPEISPGSNGTAEWAQTIRVLGTPGAKVLSSEPRLILLVILAGGLGSYVHASTSFVTYVGNRSLRASWTWWYLLRPFIGMALALIFYFVVRGGLLSGGAQASEVSPFGITAIAGLVGMFSKQATDKLQEVFDNLFRTQKGKGDDQRQDKLSGGMPVTEKMVPINTITAYQLSEGQQEDGVKILDLYRRYGGVVTRLPILDDRGAVQAVIHQSLVYKFISDRSVTSSDSGTPIDLKDLTLADFMKSPGMKALVTDSLAWVSVHATLSEAKAKMDETPKCQDVFVTDHGVRDEPVKGWLTNVEIGRLSTV
jgi:hypothetical protein